MLEQELSIIKQAIINELEGYEFYKMASAQAESAEVRQTFMQLASEEQLHIEWLNELFTKLKTSPEDAMKLAVLDNPPSPGIFNWDKLDRKHAGVAVSVFGIGVQMERASVEFYDQAAKETKFEASRQLFEILSKWEAAHLATFSTEYDKYQEIWWSDQDYAPF